MIHINSSKGSSMFSRRPRGVIQTTIILLLFVSVGYVMYLNNALQDKLKTLDVKAQRYQSQHQALSSQLQVVYEDRTRLEKSLQKEKSEHLHTKTDLEQQKDAHESILDELHQEHNEKYNTLIEEHANVKDQLERARQDLDDAEKVKVALKSRDDDRQLQMENHEKEKSQLDAQNKELKDQLSQISQENSKSQSRHSDLNSQLQQMQGEVENFNKLKNALKSAGADVIKLDHAHLGEMDAESRLLLFSHVGGSAAHAHQLERQRLQMREDQAGRQAAIQRQIREKKERDKLLASREAAAAAAAVRVEDDTNPCLMLPEQGNCQDNVVRYYFDPRTSSCILLQYTGCGGNGNNFESPEDCEAQCIDMPRGKHADQQNHQIEAQGSDVKPQPNLPQQQEQLHHDVQQILPVQQNIDDAQRVQQQQLDMSLRQQTDLHEQALRHLQNEQGMKPQGNIPDEDDGQDEEENVDGEERKPIEHQQIAAINNIDPDGRQREEINLPRGDMRYPQDQNAMVVNLLGEVNRPTKKPNEDGVDNDDDNHDERDNNGDEEFDENAINPAYAGNKNPVDLQEARAREADHRAKLELQKMKDDQQDAMDKHQVLDMDEEGDPLDKVRQMQLEQQQIVDQQADNFKKLAALKAEEKIHGVITDEEEDQNVGQQRGEQDEFADPRQVGNPDDQMHRPPAAKVVADDGNPVIDAPGHELLPDQPDEADKTDENYEEDDYDDNNYDDEDDEANRRADDDAYGDAQLERPAGDNNDYNDEGDEMNEADSRHENAIKFADRQANQRDFK